MTTMKHTRERYPGTRITKHDLPGHDAGSTAMSQWTKEEFRAVGKAEAPVIQQHATLAGRNPKPQRWGTTGRRIGVQRRDPPGWPQTGEERNTEDKFCTVHLSHHTDSLITLTLMNDQ